MTLRLASHDWPATIDTGFNGDLELPEALRAHVNPQFIGSVQYSLGGGQTALEDNSFNLEDNDSFRSDTDIDMRSSEVFEDNSRDSIDASVEGKHNDLDIDVD